QEVFFKALGGLATYEPRGASFGSWLLRIARNAAFDFLRGAGRSFPADPRLVQMQLDDEVAFGPRPDESVGDYDVLGLVDQLPADQREILLLRYSLGFDPREIAALLGRSQAGISGSRHRALRALEEALSAAKHPASAGGRVRTSGRVVVLPAL